MGKTWFACGAVGVRPLLEGVAASIGPVESLRWVEDPSELRELLHDEEPRTVCALVGPQEGGVSEVNLAAALVSDGHAEEVVLVPRLASGSLRSRAARAGVSRVIELPRVPMAREARVEAPSAGVDVRTLAQGPQAPVLAFCSGRGGVGKTALAATCAAIAASWDMKVALLDLDLSCGNLGSAFGAARRGDLAELAAAPLLTRELVDACGIPCEEGVRLWGPCLHPETAESAMPIVGDLISELAATHDLLLCDTSTTCTDAVAEAMQRADRLVFVQGEAPGAVADVARMSALAVRLGVPRTKIARIENHAPARSWGQAFMPRAEVGLETARAYRVLEGGDEVAELVGAGHLAELVELDGDFVRSVATFLARVLKEVGCLPACPEAEAAAEGGRVRRMGLFSRRREAN